MLNISKQFISYNRSSRSTSPIYIVIHDTGDAGATAQNEHDYFAGGDRSASADLFVDSDNIIQIIDTDNYYSWHCGDGGGAYGITNANSLGIEMCLGSDGNPTDDTVSNTVELVQYLMDKYSIGIDNVVRHYDASRKNCPGSFMSNSWARWYDFKEQVENGATTSGGTWQFQDSKWWYKHSDGSYTKDGWEKINSYWYLFDSDGYMVYEWKKSGGNWYYLSDSNNDGAMKTGWIFDKNYSKWYYCDSNGVMKTAWQKIDSNWYYFDASGAMQTGWISYNGKDYCCYSNGAMICNTTAYGYSFASDGVATKLG